MGSKGFKATKHLRRRAKNKRGGNAQQAIEFDRTDPDNMADYTEEYLQWLAVMNYTEDTIEGRRYALKVFLGWARERDLICACDMTKPILESYMRFLHRFRKPNGKPLGYSTQRGRISAVRDFFRWLCRQNYILYNPASELEMPRPEKRLPDDPISLQQVESILSVPDLSEPLGVRDRSIMELLYSTGMRRLEAVNLELTDLNCDKQTIHIRQGKGHKDRIIPVGDRALTWLERYLEDIRPQLVISISQAALYLSSYGEAFNPDVLSRKVARYVKKADIGRSGSCHMFRHACATHMLENGADIRIIQQLLGHEKLETTQIYTEVSITQLQEVHKRTHPAKLK